MRDPIRSARLRVHDMLDHIQFAREAAAHLTLEQFLEQRLNRLATERSIGIISEASRRLGEDLKATAPANTLAEDCRDRECPASRLSRCRPGNHLERRSERSRNIGIGAASDSGPHWRGMIA